MYEEYTDGLGSKTIKKIDEDGREFFIPINPANSDYQAYLEHLTENPTEDVE